MTRIPAVPPIDGPAAAPGTRAGSGAVHRDVTDAAWSTTIADTGAAAPEAVR